MKRVWNRITGFLGLDTKPEPERKRKRRPNGVNVRLAVTLPAMMVEIIERAAEKEGLPVSLVVEQMLMFAMEDVDNQRMTDETTIPQIVPDCPVPGGSAG